jgi:integrase
MASVRFILKSQKNPASLYVRFKSGREIDLVAATGFSINPKHWSNAKQSMKNVVEENPVLQSHNVENKFRYDKLNKSLNNLKEFILIAFNDAQSEGEIMDKSWLEGIIVKCFNRPVNSEKDGRIFFIPFVEKLIDEAPTKIRKKTNKPVSFDTIKTYKSTLTKLLQFEEYMSKKIKYKELDLNFHKNFLHFLNNVQKLNLKTTGNYIKNVKVFARQALLEGFPVSDEINHPEFFKTNSKTKAIYLTEEEINKIFNYDFSNNERLDKARDLLIVGLWTGQRIGDFKNINASNIKNGFIEITTNKTGTEVVIPIHYQVQKILKKWNNDFPPPLSDPKFNEYIKEVGRIVGLTSIVNGAKMNPETKRKEEGDFPKYELITSHICRRSFATNHYGKLPTPTIMAITGHQSEKVFLGYIQTTPKEHAERMRELWLKQAKENNYEEVKLKVVK